MEYRLKKLSPEQQEEAGLAERYTIAAPGAEPDAEAELVPPPISTLSRLIGGWRYVIETDEWHDADETRTETRCYRSLRKFEEVEEFKLTADMCRWDVMQHDRDTELQALEVFRMIDVSGDGLLDRGAFASPSDLLSFRLGTGICKRDLADSSCLRHSQGRCGRRWRSCAAGMSRRRRWSW